MIAGIVATSCGCKVDEGSVHPCIVFGKDIRELLYRMSMMGWFGIGTFPTGMIALVIFSAIVWRRNRNTASDPDGRTRRTLTCEQIERCRCLALC